MKYKNYTMVHGVSSERLEEIVDGFIKEMKVCDKVSIKRVAQPYDTSPPRYDVAHYYDD